MCDMTVLYMCCTVVSAGGAEGEEVRWLRSQDPEGVAEIQVRPVLLQTQTEGYLLHNAVLYSNNVLEIP